ncbi:unnamed protein product [Calicophoron daubneyi]|uniref:DNA excision repair protein ERCC-6 n=1 Tax=Calicophoron daubneyi TaxID=300641 RepID=A0AAV2TRA3_CALDB
MSEAVTPKKIAEMGERKGVVIDRTQIPHTEFFGLKNVEAYKQGDFEAGVIEQATEAFKKRTNDEIKETRQRLTSLEEDINFAQSELEEMERRLDSLLTEASASTSNVPHSRRVRSLELEIELKMKKMDTLKSRKLSLDSKITSLERAYSGEKEETSPFPSRKSTEGICTESQSTSQEATVHPAGHQKKPDSTAKVRARTYTRQGELIRKIRKLRQTKYVDDASTKSFQQRLQRRRRLEVLEEQLAMEHGELHVPPPDGQLAGNFFIPGRIWSQLYDYQRSGVSWLWKLHQQRTGGILGDEMGLGKTIQLIAFFAGLQYSNFKQECDAASNGLECTPSESKGLGCTLIVCPATVLQQWMDEFHKWYPPLRVAVLHSTGSLYGNVPTLIRSMASHSGTVLLTTYGTLIAHADTLLAYDWSYLVLDEGHKIKNPAAEVTITLKRFSTPHRLILSGSPVQNNLRELWSLFDFVCPGRLGPLPEFMQQFSIPITQGGYASASPLQVETAYRCACTLRDLLSPFLLRRLKADVRIQLPQKSEQVLFCRLTNYQRQLYQEFTESQTCKDLLRGKGNVFTALILLRKLCNHPDLITGGPRDRILLGEQVNEDDQDELNAALTSFSWDKFGCPRRSSKMLVVASLLKTWAEQGNKVLLFSQSRRMLNLLERLVIKLNLPYLRMDGSTPIGQRQSLIREFNTPSSSEGRQNVVVFLLTTRVGGLGVNLTAANRVLIYDPDWNPTTDIQARERAWRIGQKRDVTIYRLLTSGTIEEKIYHRQIFKQFLTNRILKNPRQQRFFKTNDLQELLAFEDSSGNSTDVNHSRPETADYLRMEGLDYTLSSTGCMNSTMKVNRFDMLVKKRQMLKQAGKKSDDETNSEESEGCPEEEAGRESRLSPLASNSDPTEDRKTQLRLFARELSRRIGEGRLEERSGLEKQNHERRKAHRKRKNGTRVDGRRIALVDRRSAYDTGEDVAEPERKAPRLTERATKPSDASEMISDVFIRELLTRPDEVSRASGDTQQSSVDVDSFARKRALVDEDTREEAMRVANQAMKNIRQLPTSSGALGPDNNHGKISKAVSREIRPSPIHDGPSDVRLTSGKGTKKFRTISVSASKKVPVKTTDGSSFCLSHVSHVLAHDRLLDALTDTNRIDSTFPRLEARRLAEQAANSVVEEAARWARTSASNNPQVQFSSSDASNTFSVVNFSANCPRFRTVKDRFLWHPDERQSPTFIHLISSLKSDALSSPTESVSSFTGSGSLLLGHVRFSSELVLELIRTRLAVRQAGFEDAQSVKIDDDRKDSGSTNLHLQRLVVELIRLLAGLTPVTSGLLASRFKRILSPSHCGHKELSSPLNAIHFRAVLRYLAERRRSKSQHQSADRSDDVWILRDRFRESARFLSGHLATCELEKSNC